MGLVFFRKPFFEGTLSRVRESRRNYGRTAVPMKFNQRIRNHRGTWLVAILVILLIGGWWIEVPRLWLCNFADRALQRYRARDALLWIERAERFYPNDIQLHLLEVRSNLQLNMNSLALEWLERAKTRGARPEVLEPYRLMAEAQRGNQSAVESLLGNASASLEAYEALIRAYEHGSQWSKANLILDQMEKAGVSPVVVLYHRGRILEISEDFEGAGRLYCEAHQKEPGSSRAAFRAGICFYHLRDFDKAVEMFSKSQFGPYRDVFAIELASCLWEKNSLEQAARVITPTLDITPSNLQSLYLQLDEFVDSDRAALVAARIEDALGHCELAVSLLRRSLSFNNREFDARGMLIKNLRALGRISEADEVVMIQTQMVATRQRCRQLRLELDSNPRDISKFCELAELYWYAESDAEAMLAISEILETEPKCERALELRGKIISNRANRQLIHRPASRL